jgi:hypothetical protein
VDIRECTFPVSELETLKAEIRAVSIQLFSTRSAVDGGEKLIRVTTATVTSIFDRKRSNSHNGGNSTILSTGF